MTTEDENRATWLTPFTTLQRRYEIRLRTVMLQAAEDAQKAVIALDRDSTFSAGVKLAQTRLVLGEIQPILKDLFNEVIPIVRNGQQDAGVLAVTQLSKTDRRYLVQGFNGNGPADAFIAGQKQSARLGIANAISSITKADYDLSSNVYGTRALANKWLKNQVTSMVLRGSSAQEIAKQVRSSIRPSTTGGVAYAALRLGRTELNNAFHATAITLSQDRPWITGMDWHLSSVHTNRESRLEICESYAKKSWSVDNVPAKPHPQCRCYVTPRLVAIAEFNRSLTAGKYRSWIDEAA